MKILPLNTSKALQINPNLGIILTANMTGWFFERYVNIFMVGTTVDYIDNVNYNATLLHRRRYSYKEINSLGVVNVIERTINNNMYMHLWVDEMYIPCSVRYNRCHFVHPLMIYGYDDEKQIIKTVFFDILSGQILVDISYQDIILATLDLALFYNIGGSNHTLDETALVYELSPHLKSNFHLEVFAQQLCNYICCETDPGWEWYTSCRAGVFDSNEKIYGIQIYLQLINYLQSPELINAINYKALHDFIFHKKIMFERLVYIQQNFFLPHEYNNLLARFEQNYRNLERMRLLGRKIQLKNGLSPLVICRDDAYLKKLVDFLFEGYLCEMEILPQIYDIINGIGGYKHLYNSDKGVRFSANPTPNTSEYLEYDVNEYNKYTSCIDVVRYGEPTTNPSFEYLLINGERKFYLHKDSYANPPIRTLKIPPLKINSLRLYTTKLQSEYSVILYPLPNQKNNNPEENIVLSNSWQGYHHIQFENNRMGQLVLQIIDEDPYIIQENIGINADEYIYLHIKMSTTVQTVYAQVYFSTVDNPHISMEKSLFFKIIPDGVSHSYYINMSHNAFWHGFVKALRFDPAQYHDFYEWNHNKNTICTIEMVEFTKRIPDGTDECMTAISLKDDGSTFKNIT